MLIACQKCHLQYDVGDQEPGAKVLCFCGEANTVPTPRTRQVRMQHCSNCGGALEDEAANCSYCEAKVALGDRGWGDSCPACMARMVKGARFCGACGVEIRVQATLRPREDLACPRCKDAMFACVRESEAFVECTCCGGVWLSDESFERIVQRTQREAVGDALPASGHEAGSGKDVLPPLPKLPVKYMPCPECSELMNRRNFAGSSGVVIDHCRQHGLWFDLHELEHIQRFVADGGIERARSRRAERDAARARGSKPTVAIPVGRPGGRGRWHSTDGTIFFEALGAFLGALVEGLFD